MSKVYSDLYLRELWNLWVLSQPDQSYKVVYANFDEMCRHVPSGPQQWIALIEKMDTFRPREPVQLRKSLATNTLEIYQGSMEQMVCEEDLKVLSERINKTSFVTTAVELLFTKRYGVVRGRNDYVFKMREDIRLIGSRSMSDFMEYAGVTHREYLSFVARMLGDEGIDVSKYFVDVGRDEEGMIVALVAAVIRSVQPETNDSYKQDYETDTANAALELFKDPEWAKKLVTEWVGKIREEGR